MVRSRPDRLTVCIDDARVGDTPLEPQAVEPGEHRIEVRGGADRVPWTERVSLRAGQRVSLKAVLIPRRVCLRLVTVDGTRALVPVADALAATSSRAVNEPAPEESVAHPLAEAGRPTLELVHEGAARFRR